MTKLYNRESSIKYLFTAGVGDTVVAALEDCLAEELRWR